MISGYTGGHVKNPGYKAVSAGGTGHVEAVKVIYDPSRVTYGELLEVFWRHVDPTDGGGQFVDRGPQYRSVIFYGNEEEKRQIASSREELAASGRFEAPVVTDILPGAVFYPAEGYHQDYHEKNPVRYNWYRSRSGRDRFLDKVWGKERGNKMSPEKTERAEASNKEEEGKTTFDDNELRRRLTKLQYKVTRENGTERPFDNSYWDNHGVGLYVDIVSGEPLFGSMDKFTSGTGWPSFTRPIEPGNIVRKVDRGLFMERTEVRSRKGDSHLGHLFDDGPKPTGLRYCINSAALRFIPLVDLEKEGYGTYRTHFKKKGGG